MNQMPLWIQVLQALLTPVIAMAVGMIGFLQWRTAHQKVVLDLFDRRLSIVDEVNNTVTYAISNHGNLVSINAAMRLYECEAKSLFLFGSEVVTLVGQIREEIHTFHALQGKLASGDQIAENAAELNDRCSASFAKVSAQQKAFVDIVMPFMRMHTKAVPTPTEWFVEKNKLRLSYADEKQR